MPFVLLLFINCSLAVLVFLNYRERTELVDVLDESVNNKLGNNCIKKQKN